VRLPARHAVRRCEIEAVEDVYSTPEPSFAVETTPEPTPTGGTPAITPYGYIEATTTGTTTGNTTLFLYDPTAAVTLVEYRTQSGTGAFSGWTTDTFPYQASVHARSVRGQPR
jgi:hypothetical protein